MNNENLNLNQNDDKSTTEFLMDYAKKEVETKIRNDFSKESLLYKTKRIIRKCVFAFTGIWLIFGGINTSSTKYYIVSLILIIICIYFIIDFFKNTFRK